MGHIRSTSPPLKNSLESPILQARYSAYRHTAYRLLLDLQLLKCLRVGCIQSMRNVFNIILDLRHQHHIYTRTPFPSSPRQCPFHAYRITSSRIPFQVYIQYSDIRRQRFKYSSGGFSQILDLDSPRQWLPVSRFRDSPGSPSFPSTYM